MTLTCLTSDLLLAEVMVRHVKYETRNACLCLQSRTGLQLAVAGRHGGVIEALIRHSYDFKADLDCRQVGALLLALSFISFARGSVSRNVACLRLCPCIVAQCQHGVT